MRRDRGVAIVSGDPAVFETVKGKGLSHPTRSASAIAHTRLTLSAFIVSAAICDLIENGDTSRPVGGGGVGGGGRPVSQQHGQQHQQQHQHQQQQHQPTSQSLLRHPDPDEVLPFDLQGDDVETYVEIQVACPGKEGRVIGKQGATIKEIERQRYVPCTDISQIRHSCRLFAHTGKLAPCLVSLKIATHETDPFLFQLQRRVHESHEGKRLLRHQGEKRQRDQRPTCGARHPGTAGGPVRGERSRGARGLAVRRVRRQRVRVKAQLLRVRRGEAGAGRGGDGRGRVWRRRDGRRRVRGTDGGDGRDGARVWYVFPQSPHSAD